MITIQSKGNFSKTYQMLEKYKELVKLGDFDKYGRMGVDALRSATPVDTGKTASCWDYKITNNSKGITIEWSNSNLADGVPIVILLQYGHATKDGYHISGTDFINPSIKPVFDYIADSIWKGVKNA